MSDNRSQTSNPYDPTRAPKTYKWTVVGMLWCICFFNYADRLAIFSVFPVLEKQYHLTKTQLGAIGASFTWVYAVGAPLAGLVGDRFPRKWVILLGLYVWSAVTGLTAICTRAWQFILVRATEGLGETFYMPASMALISDYHTPKTRSRAIGLHQTSIYAGTIAGASIAGGLALNHAWQTPFVVLAIAGFVLGAILHRSIRDPGRNAAERSLHRANAGIEEPHLPVAEFLATFVRTPAAVLLVAAFFGANMVAFVFLTWMPTFLKEKFGLNLLQAGVGATIFIQTASMVGSLLGGVAADRWSLRTPMGRIYVQAIAVLAGVPFVYFCGFTRSIGALIAAMTLYGLSKGAYDSNLTAAFYDVIAPDRRSTATGIMNFVGWIGAGLGAYAIGVAVDHKITMSVAISSTATIYLVVAGLLLCAARCIPRSLVAAPTQPTSA